MNWPKCAIIKAEDLIVRNGWNQMCLQVQAELAAQSPTAHLPREHWDTWDPMLISEGLFAAANIFSNLKLVYIFSVNPYLGPLQVTLSRMVIDILKFVSLFFLVLFSFSCGKYFLLKKWGKIPLPVGSLAENQSNSINFNADQGRFVVC